MSASVFGDKSKEPTASDLDRVLGESAAFLKDIEQHVNDVIGDLAREWKFYGKKAGWTLALAHKGRRVFHLIPQSNLFTVVFTLGKRAVSVALKSDLPGEVLAAISGAHEYAEGRSIRIDVAVADDILVIKQLVAIKMSS
jgi:hypothetical protein